MNFKIFIRRLKYYLQYICGNYFYTLISYLRFILYNKLLFKVVKSILNYQMHFRQNHHQLQSHGKALILKLRKKKTKFVRE